MRECRRHAALGHHRVRLAEQRLADQPDIGTGRLGFDGGAEPCPTRTDDEDVVGSGLRVGLIEHRPRSRGYDAIRIVGSTGSTMTCSASSRT